MSRTRLFSKSKSSRHDDSQRFSTFFTGTKRASRLALHLPVSTRGKVVQHTSCANILCMRTTLDIDAQLMEETIQLSGERTKAAAVEAALREYVRLRRKELLLSLPGNIRLEENWRGLRQAELS